MRLVPGGTRSTGRAGALRRSGIAAVLGATALLLASCQMPGSSSARQIIASSSSSMSSSSLSPLMSRTFSPLSSAGLCDAETMIPAASGTAGAIPAPALDEPATGRPKTETAVLAGGCFWGVQGVFQHVKGVSSAQSGYAGGDAATANYDAVTINRATYAVSLEPEGGSPTGAPTGPVLFTGKLLQVTPPTFAAPSP